MSGADGPLSVLHVLAPADFGGLETVVKTLAAGHASMGHTVAIAAVLNSPNSAFVDEARALGLRVHVIESPARSFAAERRGVRALLESANVNVLHSHGYRSDILDIAVARAMGVPSVTTFHGFSATDRKGRFYERLQRWRSRRASAIVAVSGDVARRLVESGTRPESVHVIRNAIPCSTPSTTAAAARARLGLPPGLAIGWVGRLSAEKGADVMLSAMQLLADLPVTLSFVGDGIDREALTQHTGRLGMTPRVYFHGRIPSAAELLPAFSVLVLSSRTEGTPMVILEAMAACIPIVATKVGGIPEMLGDDQAFIVEPENPAALAAGIRSALTNPAMAAERAKRARTRLIDEFGVQPWLAEYEALYRTIQPRQAGGAIPPKSNGVLQPCHAAIPVSGSL